MTSLVVSVDELRAAARLAGVGIPPVAVDDDPDDPRVDLAALRGLAARGLIVGLSEADPEPAGVLAPALAALDEPDWLLDVELDEGVRSNGQPHGDPGDRRRWNQAHGRAGSVEVTRLLGGLVQVDLDVTPGSAAEVALRCGLLADPAVPGAELAPTCVAARAGFVVSADAHLDADSLALAGRLDAAVDALVGAGAPRQVAHDWVEAVATRRSASAVRLARRLDGLAVEERELRWLVGGRGDVWQVDAGPAEDRSDCRGGRGRGVTRADDDHVRRLDGAADGDVSRVGMVDASDVRAALAELLRQPEMMSTATADDRREG